MPRYCPTCGQRVRIHTEDDGTSFYEAVDSARIAELEAAIEKALAVRGQEVGTRDHPDERTALGEAKHILRAVTKGTDLD